MLRNTNNGLSNATFDVTDIRKAPLCVHGRKQQLCNVLCNVLELLVIASTLVLFLSAQSLAVETASSIEHDDVFGNPNLMQKLHNQLVHVDKLALATLRAQNRINHQLLETIGMANKLIGDKQRLSKVVGRTRQQLIDSTNCTKLTNMSTYNYSVDRMASSLTDNLYVYHFDQSSGSPDWYNNTIVTFGDKSVAENIEVKLTCVPTIRNKKTQCGGQLVAVGNKCYQFGNISSNWTMADDYCYRLNMSLVRVDNSEDNYQLAAEVRRRFGIGQQYWIGLTCEAMSLHGSQQYCSAFYNNRAHFASEKLYHGFIAVVRTSRLYELSIAIHTVTNTSKSASSGTLRPNTIPLSFSFDSGSANLYNYAKINEVFRKAFRELYPWRYRNQDNLYCRNWYWSVSGHILNLRSVFWNPWSYGEPKFPQYKWCVTASSSNARWRSEDCDKLLLPVVCEATGTFS